MSIKSIDELKESINQSTLVIFSIILFFSLIGSYFIHAHSLEKEKLLNRQKINSAIESYKSNLSEKLSIISSSTVFLDYLHSGEETRSQLYPQFLYQLSSLKSKSISGMNLMDSNKVSIANYGTPTKTFITIDLCYLNRALDSEMGGCRFYWKLFFNKKDLINEIIKANHSIKNCNECLGYEFLQNYLGNFKIHDSLNINLKLTIPNKKDYFFYSYLALMTFTLILFAIWNWHRLNKLLNTYITDPIKNLAKSLKSNSNFKSENSIEEINYLAQEINSWQLKLEQMKSDENSIKLGKIAAQVAHDIRSPISVIDMLINDAPNFPEERTLILRHALQRIEDISNNFLAQYKSPSEKEEITREYIPEILENMISEKRIQYGHRNIEFVLTIEDTISSFSWVHAGDFKRVLSNLINNAIESISNSGTVKVNLFALENSLRIEIIDNGCGIDNEMLPKIKAGGISVGKKYGSGLGLSHAIKKIKEWNGTLEITSQVRVGTAISIQLPSAAKTRAMNSS